MLRGQPIPPVLEVPFETSFDDLVGNYIGPLGQEIVVTCEDTQVICTFMMENTTSTNVIMQKDEKSVLRVNSDTQHHSIGFFQEPETGFRGLMLGTLAFKKTVGFL